MAVYILGAGASCCTDAYQRHTLEFSPEEPRPPLMADFFRIAGLSNDTTVPLVQLDPILKPLGLSLNSLQRGTAGCANIETVLSFCDLLERATAHWAFGHTSPPELPQQLQELCEKVRGWPLFGGSPEQTLMRAADALRDGSGGSEEDRLPPNIREWSGAWWSAHSAVRDALRAICGVYAPPDPYEHPGRAGLPGLCSNYSAFFSDRLRPGDTVVSFNYDFLLDMVLEEKGDLGMPDPADRLPTVFHIGGGKARFLRLHGSVLWYVQRNWDQNRDYYLGNPNAGDVGYRTFCKARSGLHGGDFPWLPPEIPPHSTRTFGACPDPEEMRKWENEPVDVSHTRYIEPLIVPPTIAKEEHLGRPEILELWRQAERDLSATDRIYVIGYSFPPGDKHVSDMTQAAGERRPSGNYEGVPLTIVTRPDATQDEDDIQDLKRKAGNAFPGAEINVAKDAEERTIGFSQWVEKTAQ